MSEFGFPLGRQAFDLQFRKFDHGQQLPATDQELSVAGPVDRKFAPEPASLETLKFTMNQQFVPEPGGSAIINFRADDDRAIALIEHPVERPAKFLGQQRTICLNEPEISYIMDQAAGVCVEKHHVNFGF